MGKKLYVGNLSYSTDDEGLRAIFAQAGTVESAKVIMNQETGQSKGFGFVEMATEEEAQESIKRFDGYECNGRTLKVSEARPQERDRGGRGGPRRGGFGGGGGGRPRNGGGGGNRPRGGGGGNRFND